MFKIKALELYAFVRC